MSLVIPLYYGHRIIIGRQIETNKFCLQEYSTNEVFYGRSALFDMFNILVGPTNKTERQKTNIYIICWQMYLCFVVCLQEYSTNEVFYGRSALFDMFNSLVGPTNKTERQKTKYNLLADVSMFRSLMKWVL